MIEIKNITSAMYSVDFVRITTRSAILAALGSVGQPEQLISGESIVVPSCTLISGPTIPQINKLTKEYSAVKMLMPLKHLAVGLQHN